MKQRDRHGKFITIKKRMVVSAPKRIVRRDHAYNNVYDISDCENEDTDKRKTNRGVRYTFMKLKDELHPIYEIRLCWVLVLKISIRINCNNMSYGATVGASAANSNLIELKNSNTASNTESVVPFPILSRLYR